MKALLIVAGLVLSTVSAGAQTLLTSAFGGTMATDFSQIMGDPCYVGSYCFTAGPKLIGTNGYDVTYNALGSNANFAAIGNGRYNLSSNGTWDGVWQAGRNRSTGSMRFTFASPVRRLGAFMNYVIPGTETPGINPMIRALDQFGETLVEFDLESAAPINTPDGFNAGAFRGIEFDTNKIWSFEVADEFLVLQDIFVDVTPREVPEPSTAALLAFGAAGIAVVSRRRKSSSDACMK